MGNDCSLSLVKSGDVEAAARLGKPARSPDEASLEGNR